MKKIVIKKDKMMKIAIATGIGVLICGTYVYAVNRPASYMVSEVQVGNVVGTVEATGEVHGEEKRTYYAEITSPVLSVPNKIGDKVSKGETLLNYRTEDLEQAVEEAKLNVAASESGYQARIKESSKYASKYAKALAEDAAYAALYAMQREDAQALEESQYSENYQRVCTLEGINKKILDKKEELSNKTNDYEELDDKTTKKAEDIKEDIDDIEDEIASLESDVSNYQSSTYTPQEYSTQNDKSNVLADINRNWQEAKTEKQTSEGQILNDSQKEQLKTNTEIIKLQAEILNDDLEVAKVGVKSEFDGIMIEKLVEDLAYVTEGTPLFTIESSDELLVEVMISKYDIGMIKEGQKAKVSIGGKSYEGLVSNISHLAQNDSSDKNKVKVDIHISNPDGNVILGIETDVIIYEEEKQKALLIPYSALYSDDDGEYCYLVSDGIIEKRYIETGVETEESIEILDGLSLGEHVITDAITDDQIGDRAYEILN